MSSLWPDPSWEDFASSPPFAITVGANKKKFYIHSALLASLSAPLSRLVNNSNFKESREANVTLEHVDEDTFAYFVQYAYSANYSVPSPPVKVAGATGFGSIGLFGAKGGSSTNIFCAPPPSIAATASNDSALPQAFGGSLFATATSPATTSTTTAAPSLFAARPTKTEPPTTKPSAPTPSGYDALWAKLTETFKEPGLFGNPRNYRPQPPARRPSSNNTGDKVPNPLLAHARLFLFADYYDIAPLSDLAFRRMGQTLLRHYDDPKAFEHAWQMEHVVELIELCWDEDRPAKLREAVILYPACRMEVLWENEGFRRVVEEKGELAVDLIGAVARRLK